MIRDTIILILIICIGVLEFKFYILSEKVSVLIEGEKLQNEINNEIIKRLYFNRD